VTSAGTVPPVTGYGILLPPGWRGIPIRSGTAAAIRALLDEVFARLGPGQSRDALVRPRIELARRLTAMADTAREHGGVDMYLPVEYVHGTAVPASFVVSLETGRTSEQGDPPEVIAALLAADPGSRPVTVDGALGVRTERVAGPDPSQDVNVASRRVDYALAVPGQPGQWLMSVFSTPGDGDPDGEFAKVLVELFDAMMSTFRWSLAGQDDQQVAAARQEPQ
jgi:hypothetical protein